MTLKVLRAGPFLLYVPKPYGQEVDHLGQITKRTISAYDDEM